MIDSLASEQQASLYLADLLRALEDERPVLTQKLTELLSERYHEVHFEFAAWLKNFSQIDLKHHTGLQEEHDNVTLLERSRSSPRKRDPKTWGFAQNSDEDVMFSRSILVN